MSRFAHLSRFFPVCRLMALLLATGAGAPASSADPTVVTSYLPPFTFPDDPQRPGFYVEVAKAAFSKAGLPFVIEFQPWARAQASALAKPGIFILGLSHTAERDRNYKFAAEILPSGICFLTVRPSGQVNSLEAARRLKAVTVRAGTNFETLLRDAGVSNIDLSQTDEQAALKLSTGHVQAWLTYDVGALFTWRKIGADPHALVLGATIEEEPVFLAAAKETPDSLIRKVHDAMKAIHADGSYDRLYAKYFGANAPR